MKQQQKGQKGKVFLKSHHLYYLSSLHYNTHALALIEINCNVILKKHFFKKYSDLLLSPPSGKLLFSLQSPA